jgi:hypothetical protein
MDGGTIRGVRRGLRTPRFGHAKGNLVNEAFGRGVTPDTGTLRLTVIWNADRGMSTKKIFSFVIVYNCVFYRNAMISARTPRRSSASSTLWTDAQYGFRSDIAGSWRRPAPRVLEAPYPAWTTWVRGAGMGCKLDRWASPGSKAGPVTGSENVLTGSNYPAESQKCSSLGRCVAEGPLCRRCTASAGA